MDLSVKNNIMYITPQVEMQKQSILSELGIPSFKQDRATRIFQLKAIKKERNFRKTMVITANEDIKRLTSSIEENLTNIRKLEMANHILLESRELYIKEIGDSFDKENEFPEDKELDNLQKEESNEMLRTYESTSVTPYPSYQNTITQFGGIFQASSTVSFEDWKRSIKQQYKPEVK